MKKRVKPTWFTEMSAKWREPAPPMGPGEAKLFAFIRDEDVQTVVPPAAPHVGPRAPRPHARRLGLARAGPRGRPPPRWLRPA